ncbi:transglutaminase domain-containing protein [Heyndrickxia sporothermodurans]
MKKVLMVLAMVLSLLFPYESTFAKTVDLTKDSNYQVIYKALQSQKSKVKVKYNSRVFAVLHKVTEDHPEIFYIDYSKITLWTNGLLELGYTGSQKTINTQIKQLNKKVNAIIKGAKSKKKKVDKIKYLHDYIVNHTKYDYVHYMKGNVPANRYNAYGVLIKGTGVCQGYADAMKLLLNKAKIPNYLVVGKAKSGHSWESHAWNLVKIGKSYYHVDTTWDDPITSNHKQVKRYNYFLLSDKEMSKDHKWDKAKYPNATSKAYSSYRKSLK